MRAVKSKMCAQSIKKKPKALEKKTIVRFRRHIQRAAKKMKTQPESIKFRGELQVLIIFLLRVCLGLCFALL